MKKIILILSVAFYLNSYSQSIPNGDFEIWSKPYINSNPANWKLKEGVPLVINESFAPNEVGVGKSSILFLNIIDEKYGNRISIVENSFVCTQRPNFMSFMGFYNCFTIKPFFVDVFFYKSNGDTVGFTRCFPSKAFFEIMKQKSYPFRYVKQEYQMNYFSGDLPDSCKITIHSAVNNDMADHSYVYFDEFIFQQVSTTDLKTEKKLASINNIRIFPNPTSGHFDIEFNSIENTSIKIELFDYTGKLIAIKNNWCRYGFNNIKFIENNLPIGYYFLKFTQNNNSYWHKVAISN